MEFKELDPKEPVTMSDKTAMLRRLVKVEDMLESQNEQAQDRLQECLNRFPATSKANFPFSTEGSGKRVAEHLKKNGYGWVHIEDIFPFDEDIDYIWDKVLNRRPYAGFPRKTVKGRLNHLHSNMKLKGLRTFKSTSYVQWFSPNASDETLRNALFDVSTLKYDLEDSTVHELKKSGNVVTVDNYEDNSTIQSVPEPLFFLLGPASWDLTLKDENGEAIKKYDSEGRHISWETREPLPHEFRMIVIPHTKNKPFVINQEKASRGSDSIYTKIAVNLDGSEWSSLRMTLPRPKMQQYASNFDWNKRVEQEKDVELPITDANKYSGNWNDIVSRILLHNQNYNLIDMNDSYPKIDTKKNQMDLITHDGKLYKTSALAKDGMIHWGSSRTGLALYGVMMKADEKSERELFLKTQGLGIVNFSSPL